MMTIRNRPVSEKLDWILQVGGKELLYAIEEFECRQH